MVEKGTRIAVRYDIAGALREAGVGVPFSQPAKRLRRMPHIFCRMLELPVGADSPVEVHESPSSFTFQVLLPPPLPPLESIRAHIIHIVPGVTKVCVAGAHLATAHLAALDIPLWRFRLPVSSLPEASTAACDGDGLLVLTVPKAISAQETSPSLLQPYQVTRKSSPSLDVLPGHLDGVPPELEVRSSAESVCASSQDFDSPPTSKHHDSICSQAPCDIEKESMSDGKEHSSNLRSG